MKGKTTIKMVAFFAILVIVIIILVSIALIPAVFPPSGTFSYSFEDDTEGWDPSGTDLDLGEGSVNWSIERSDDMSSDGNASMKLYLNNLNDAGKIWIERRFDVKTNHQFRVKVEYDFSSADFGSFNLWTIITGASPKSPETYDDLVSAFRDDTGNGHDSDVGYKWLSKTYEFTAQSSSEGELWVYVGVWGTWEGPRTYYLDDLQITLTE